MFLKVVQEAEKVVLASRKSLYDAVETFRQAMKGGAESDVLRESDNIPVRFESPTLAHPREKARVSARTRV